jgi:NADH-quinone oxidoreductase subunit L
MDVSKHSFSWATAALSTVLALAGIGVAAALYGRGKRYEPPEALKPLHSLFQNKLFVDEIYGATVVKPAEVFAAGSRQFDLFLDSLARLLSLVPRLAGAVLRPLQNGQTQFYGLGMILGLAVFLTVVVVRSLR